MSGFLPNISPLSSNGWWRGHNPSGTSEGTVALNAGSYSYGSGGHAVMLCAWLNPQAGNLTDFWIKVKSFNGTWGSTDGVINWEIREGYVATRRPGGTLVASGTITLDGSTTGWKKVSPTPVALNAYGFYSLIIYDSDGGATNYVTLVSRCSGTVGSEDTPMCSEFGVTTDGFSTAFSTTSGLPAVFLKIDGRFIVGSAWDATATVASGTYHRGICFTPPENCTLIGCWCRTDSNILVSHGKKLFSGSTLPGGTADKTWAAGTSSVTGSAPAMTTQIFDEADWVNLVAGTTYRFVVDHSASVTTPRKTTISGSPDADQIAALLPFNGAYYWTEDSGGAWVDDTDAIAQFGPILIPNTDAGGGSVIVVEGD